MGGMGGGFDPDLPGINGMGTYLPEAERMAVVAAAAEARAKAVGDWETRDASGTIGGWLGGQGYGVRTSTKPTVEDLEAFSKVGVFFWQTHSGLGELRALLKDANGNVVVDAAGKPVHRRRSRTSWETCSCRQTPSPRLPA